jgi:hypothetical protein
MEVRRIHIFAPASIFVWLAWSGSPDTFCQPHAGFYGYAHRPAAVDCDLGVHDRQLSLAAGIKPSLIVINDRPWTFSLSAAAGLVVIVSFAYARHNVEWRGAVAETMVVNVIEARPRHAPNRHS